MIKNTRVIEQAGLAERSTAMAIPLQFYRSDMQANSAPSFCDIEVPDHPARPYNEQAFRYFLSIEGKRSERSSRLFALLLVDLRSQRDMSERIDREVAAAMFSAFSDCLRETDFIGWYREDVVAGAVLTQLTSGTDSAEQVRQRVSDTLIERLLPDVGRRIQVRTYHLPAQAQELGENRS